jgi:hypothetical protein
VAACALAVLPLGLAIHHVRRHALLSD